MNCKPGDLAVHIGGPSGPRNAGKIVKVVRFVGMVLGLPRTNYWLVEGGPIEFAKRDGPTRTLLPYSSDTFLRPLRDGDGDDETLTWAGRPVNHPEATPRKEPA